MLYFSKRIQFSFGDCLVFLKFAVPESKDLEGEVDEWLKSVVC